MPRMRNYENDIKALVYKLEGKIHVHAVDFEWNTLQSKTVRRFYVSNRSDHN